jgi:hypothetical protein
LQAGVESLPRPPEIWVKAGGRLQFGEHLADRGSSPRVRPSICAVATAIRPADFVRTAGFPPDQAKAPDHMARCPASRAENNHAVTATPKTINIYKSIMLKYCAITNT